MKRLLGYGAVFFGLVLHAGCGLLDPTDSSTTVDAGNLDLGVVSITGSVCALADLRDYRTCAAIAKANIEIAAYGAVTTTPLSTTTTSATGQFSLTIPLSDVGGSVLLYANDPSAQYYASLDRFPVVAGESVALPLVTTQAINNLVLELGVPLDHTLGILFAYMVNSTGVPQSGVHTVLQAATLGPYYDGTIANTLAETSATGADGLVAYFNAPLGLTTFTVTSPSTVTFQDTIAQNAITFTTVPVVN